MVATWEVTIGRAFYSYISNFVPLTFAVLTVLPASLGMFCCLPHYDRIHGTMHIHILLHAQIITLINVFLGELINENLLRWKVIHGENRQDDAIILLLFVHFLGPYK